MASRYGVVRRLHLLLAPLLLVPVGALAAVFEEVPATFLGVAVLVTGMSGDGQVLLGRAVSAGSPAGIRWTQAGGWQDLGPPPGNDYGRPSAASFDGSRVAATGNVASGHRLVLGSGWQTLFGGEALAISADGSVVAGSVHTATFPFASSYLHVWREGVGTTTQLVVSDWYWSFRTTAITGDGSAVFGNRQHFAGASFPMRFATGGGGVDLPLVPEGTGDCDPGVSCWAYAQAVSDDGSTAVGTVFLSGVAHAVRWPGGGADPPRFLDGGPPAPESFAVDVSGSGNMIVGDREGAPFLWTAGGGMQDLKDLLEGVGIDLEGWTLLDVVAISDDGSVIAGTATRPDASYAIWLAQAPELVPAAEVPALPAWGCAALAAALAAAALRRSGLERPLRPGVG
jgi:uncharacterized membrane protein